MDLKILLDLFDVGTMYVYHILKLTVASCAAKQSKTSDHYLNIYMHKYTPIEHLQSETIELM